MQKLGSTSNTTNFHRTIEDFADSATKNKKYFEQLASLKPSHRLKSKIVARFKSTYDINTLDGK